MEDPTQAQELESNSGSDSSNNAARSFEFVTISGPSEMKASETSKKIRVQAMKDYIRRQHQQAAAGGHETIAESTPAAPALYKGKFKLSSWTHKARTKAQMNQKLRVSKRETDADESAGELGNHAPVLLGNADIVQDPAPPVSGSKIDPFDSLSIALHPRSERLLVRYHTVYRTNSIAVNPEGDFFHHASADSAMLHAILYLVALHRDVEFGVEDSVETLYHGRETFRIINARLKEMPNGADDATIAAVSMLANRENLSGKYEKAKVHMSGLQKLVNLRGGIDAASGIYQRMIAWSDLLYSTIWGAPPFFPLITNLSNLSTYVVEENYLADLQTAFGVKSSINNTIHFLQTLSTILEFQNLPRIDRIGVSNLIYFTEYNLLLKDEAVSGVISGFEALALRTALHIYLYIVIREIPQSSTVVAHLSNRLIQALKSQSKDWWGESIERQRWLMWILFIGVLSSSEPVDRWWLMEKLRLSCALLEINDSEWLKSNVRKLLWQERFGTQNCALLWEEVMAFAGADNEFLF